MSNTWKYSSVGQSERYRLIGDGNSDVYKTEKALNSSLKKLRESLGLSTDEVDNWDKKIDDAYKKSSRSSLDLPKFLSSKEEKATSAYNTYVKRLNKETEAEIDKAVREAKQESEYISEWLASNGFSKDGNTATREKKKISDELGAVLEKLMNSYNDKSEKARSEYLKMLLK